jgi:hypothetical protein
MHSWNFRWCHMARYQFEQNRTNCPALNDGVQKRL